MARQVGIPKRLRASSTLTMAAPTAEEDQITLQVLAGDFVIGPHHPDDAYSMQRTMADIRTILVDLEVWLSAGRRHAELQPPEALARDKTFLLVWQATRAIYELQEDLRGYGSNPAQLQERVQDDGGTSDSSAGLPEMVSSSSSNEGVFFPEFESSDSSDSASLECID